MNRDIASFVLMTLQDAARCSPIPHLQEAATLALRILRIIDGVKANKEGFARLAKDSCELVYGIICAQTLNTTISQSLQENSWKLIRTLASIEEYAKKELKCNLITRVIRHKSVHKEILEYRETLRQSLDLFGVPPSVDSLIVSFWGCLEDAEQDCTPDGIELQSVVRMTMGIVKNIAGKNDSPIHSLAKKACGLIYVLLGSPETLQAISWDPVIDNIGDLQRTLESIGKMLDKRSVFDPLRYFVAGESKQKICGCEEVLDDFISRFGLSEVLKSKIEVVNRVMEDRGLLENLLSQPRPIMREGVQRIPTTVDQGRQDERIAQEDPPPYPEDSIDGSSRRGPFLVYREDRRILVDASHHTMNMNSGNTRVTTIVGSNNDSSVRIYDSEQ